MAGRQWTEEEIRDIYEARATKSASQLAAVYGASRNSIAALWHRERQKRGDPPMRKHMALSPEVREARRLAKLAAKATREHRRRNRIRLVRTKSEPPPLFPEPITDGIPFAELTSRNCHYPLGARFEPVSLFCGTPANEGQPYCPYHMGICYRPTARQIAERQVMLMEAAE